MINKKIFRRYPIFSLSNLSNILTLKYFLTFFFELLLYVNTLSSEFDILSKDPKLILSRMPNDVSFDESKLKVISCLGIIK